MRARVWDAFVPARIDSLLGKGSSSSVYRQLILNAMKSNILLRIFENYLDVSPDQEIMNKGLNGVILTRHARKADQMRRRSNECLRIAFTRDPFKIPWKSVEFCQIPCNSVQFR